MKPLVLAPLSAALRNSLVAASKCATPETVLVPFTQTPPPKVTDTLYTFPLARGAALPEKVHPLAPLPLIVPAAEIETLAASVPAEVAAAPE